jgi:hypothetical protein
MKQKLGNWLPMGFCAALSLICVTAFIGFPTAWVIPFLCFLPMCFYFVATVTSNLQREIRELREQVAKLQEKRVESHDAA